MAAAPKDATEYRRRVLRELAFWPRSWAPWTDDDSQRDPLATVTFLRLGWARPDQLDVSVRTTSFTLPSDAELLPAA